MWNFDEADTAEELAEMAVSFLRHELEAERALVAHGDEQHSEPVTQAFKALSLQDIDTILWDWTDIARESTDVCSRYGTTSVLVAPLALEERAWFGLLYVERKKPFATDDRARLQEFATEYSRRLSLHCQWQEPVVPQESPKPAPPPPPKVALLRHHAWSDLRPLVMLDWF